MNRILFPFSLLLLLAATACSPGGVVEGNPDNTITDSSNPTDTVPGNPTDNPSVGEIEVLVTVPTTLNGDKEPCAITIHNGDSLFEGWSDEDIVVQAKIGDRLMVFAGGSFVAPTESRQFTNLDPPGGKGFPVHFIGGGDQLAISVPVEVEVTGSEIIAPETKFHQYAQGVWTIAEEGRWVYFATDDISTYYIADPVTQDPTILVSWAGFRGALNGSNYSPFGDISAEGQWNPDGTVTLELVDVGGQFDHIFTAFPGEESDDPR